VPKSDSECQFCRIIGGSEPARVVCETKECLAFFPLYPAVLGHTLVVPRQHVRDIWSLDNRLAAKVTDAVLLVGRSLKTALKPEGMNIINSAGEAAGQTVYHLHVHLVPRWPGDRMGDIWPPREAWGEAVLDETADLVRAAFGAAA
jgi:histidine triad (HIT) family protein